MEDRRERKVARHHGKNSHLNQNAPQVDERAVAKPSIGADGAKQEGSTADGDQGKRQRHKERIGCRAVQMGRPKDIQQLAPTSQRSSERSSRPEPDQIERRTRANRNGLVW